MAVRILQQRLHVLLPARRPKMYRNSYERTHLHLFDGVNIGTLA